MKVLRLRYGGEGSSNPGDPLRRRYSSRLFHNKRRKRRITLINKAHELATRCDAHVYVLIRYGGRYYSYKSLESASWPPLPQDVDSSYPLPVQFTSRDLCSLPPSPVAADKAVGGTDDKTASDVWQGCESGVESSSSGENDFDDTTPLLPALPTANPMALSYMLNDSDIGRKARLERIEEQPEHDLDNEETEECWEVPFVFVP